MKQGHRAGRVSIPGKTQRLSLSSTSAPPLGETRNSKSKRALSVRNPTGPLRSSEFSRPDVQVTPRVALLVGVLSGVALHGHHDSGVGLHVPHHLDEVAGVLRSKLEADLPTELSRGERLGVRRIAAPFGARVVLREWQAAAAEHAGAARQDHDAATIDCGRGIRTAAPPSTNSACFPVPSKTSVDLLEVTERVSGGFSLRSPRRPPRSSLGSILSASHTLRNEKT